MKGSTFKTALCTQRESRVQFEWSKEGRRLPSNFPTIPCILKEGVKQGLGAYGIGKAGSVRL